MRRVENEENKLVLRRAAIARRNALTEQECLHLSRAIQARALELPAYQTSRSVVLYSAIDNEVSTEDILDHALISGRKVFYPRTAPDGGGELIGIDSSRDLCAGRYGIREPSGAERLSKHDCEGLVIVVPGLAFDLTGNRLGRGKGWYDRVLAQLEDRGTVVGLAYDCQIVEKVPVKPWDRKVHFIVTENKVVDCEAAAATAPRLSQ
jgi:5-formyltetrahydrofolate cyclo-ligase